MQKMVSEEKGVFGTALGSVGSWIFLGNGPWIGLGFGGGSRHSSLATPIHTRRNGYLDTWKKEVDWIDGAARVGKSQGAGHSLDWIELI